MYNPYLPSAAAAPPPECGQKEQNKKRGLSGLWKSLRLDELDTGDMLLLLILFLFWLDDDGDNTELLITLALILFL